MAGVPVDKQLEGKGCASERCQITTHFGTHLDAPWHYHPTMNGGERAWTIDEVPLEWCFGRGVKLDFRDKPDGYVCSAADVEAELERIGHTLQPFDIVLVNTSAGARYPRLKAEYEALNTGGGEPFDAAKALAPLPRAWQWLDGSTFDSHGDLMDKVFGMEKKERSPKPLMYQASPTRSIRRGRTSPSYRPTMESISRASTEYH